jgi:hypothetical protein
VKIPTLPTAASPEIPGRAICRHLYTCTAGSVTLGGGLLSASPQNADREPTDPTDRDARERLAAIGVADSEYAEFAYNCSACSRVNQQPAREPRSRTPEIACTEAAASESSAPLSAASRASFLTAANRTLMVDGARPCASRDRRQECTAARVNPGLLTCSVSSQVSFGQSPDGKGAYSVSDVTIRACLYVTPGRGAPPGYTAA